MNATTVIIRDLRRLVRRSGTFHSRSIVGSIGFLSLLLTVLCVDFGFISGVAKGKVIFQVLSVVLTLSCALRGAMMTSDVLSEERRDGTLGLLFLTPLSQIDLLLGRFVSSSWSSLYGVVGLIPIVGLALIFGGVLMGDLFRLGLVLLNTLFLSLMCGLVVSSVARDARQALTTSLFLVGLITLGPYLALIVSAIYFQTAPPLTGLPMLYPSPIYTLVCSGCFSGTNYFPKEFYQSLLVGHGIGWSLFVMSAVLLRWSFKHSTRTPNRTNSGRSGMNVSLFKRWQERTNATWRQRCLQNAPYSWFFGRGAGLKGRYEFYLVALLFLGIVAFHQMPNEFDFQLLLFLLAIIPSKIWLLVEVVNRFRDERGLGSFELLLTSPLGVEGIVRGTNRGLWRSFGWGLTGLFWLSLGIYLWANVANSWSMLRDFRLVYWPYWIGVVLDLWALKWMGMWSGVRARGSNRAYLGPIFWVLCFPWVLLLTVGFLWKVYRLDVLRTPSDDLTILEELRLWMWCSYPVAIAFGWRARFLFLYRLKPLAQHGFDFRSAEREWLTAKSSKSGRRGNWHSQLPWPKPLRYQLLATFGIVLLGVIVWSQGRRMYYEHVFRERLTGFRVEQKPVPPGWITGKDDFGSLPAPLARLAVRVVDPRSIPSVDRKALDPALSHDSDWNAGFSRSERIRMLELVRSKNPEVVEELIGLDESDWAGETVESRALTSWNQARGMQILLDLLGCEIYYRVLRGEEADAGQVLRTAVRLKIYLVGQESTYFRSLGRGVSRLEAWVRLLLSTGALSEEDLRDLDRYLEDFGLLLSIVSVEEEQFHYLRSTADLPVSQFRWGQGSEAKLMSLLLGTGRLVGHDARECAELIPWAEQLLNSLEQLESGNPSVYLELTDEYRSAQLSQRGRTLPFTFSIATALRGSSMTLADHSVDQIVRLRFTRCGLAIEQFRRERLRWPRSREEIPGFGSEEKWTDLYTGEPVVYEQEGDGYVLRSGPAWTLSYGRKVAEKRLAEWRVPVESVGLSESEK